MLYKCHPVNYECLTKTTCLQADFAGDLLQRSQFAKE